MEWTKVTEQISIRNITVVKYPYSNPKSAMRIRKEKSCFFCSKKYSDCEFLGITMSDKGSKLCCDDCAKKFESTLSNER